MNKRKTGMKTRKLSMKKLILLVTVILTALVTALLTAHLLTPSVYDADIRLSSSCTLADAIIAANNDRAEGDCPAGRDADIIILTRDITLDGGLPKITSAITIEGEGYTISGDNRHRIFYNDGGALTIKDLTMTKGRVEGDIIRNAVITLKATTAQPVGGAIVNWQGTVTISDSTFSGNSAEWGGAIFNAGELNIVSSTFSHNLASDGGAIANRVGELSISDSTFSHNSADFGGVSDEGGAIDNIGELSITNSSFRYNSAGFGGAIHNGAGELSISDSSFSLNSAEIGGAIHNWDELSITNSSFSLNSARYSGGAIDNMGELSIVNSVFSDNSAEESGGAIDNDEELSISSSTFSDNSADGFGGAINNWGKGKLSISNSTFSDNSAEHWGGGAINNYEGELSIVSSTFSGNSADKGGAIDNGEDGKVRMTNSIIAGNGDACYSDSRIRHNINNFIQDGTCSPAFKGDPMLGELVEPKDGSPAYFPLLAGSRAIDAADDEYCPETDQIGTTRPQGGGCDIGAIEYAAP